MNRQWIRALACALALALWPAALAEGERIAVICGPLADNPGAAQVAEKAEALRDVFGYELTLLECADGDRWSEGYARAAAQAYDLILGVGGQAAGQAAPLAEAHRERTAFAVIDADADSEYVASYSYPEEQSACLIGVMAAAAFPEDALFGCLCGDGNATAERIRLGFEAGVRRLLPGAEVRFALAASDDAARDRAVALRAEGCEFIFCGPGAGEAGLADAARALAQRGTPLYFAGQGAGADSPWRLTGQLKNTGVAAAIAIDNFYAGTLEPGLTVLDLASGAIGAHYITDSAEGRNATVLTDAVLDACREASDAIIDGALTPIPPR